MSAVLIFGVDFKKANPRADRAFWIGSSDPVLETVMLEIMNVALVNDTAPSEYCTPADEPA